MTEYTKETSDLQKLLDEATPGPWSIDARIAKQNGTAYERISGGDWISFARVWVRMEFEDSYCPEGLANARLIAMAPDLAAALIHEREAHAETQAALRAFIADLDRANAALILAKEALTEYRESLCEGFCSDVPPGYCDKEMLNDCGGCRARAALDALGAE